VIACIKNLRRRSRISPGDIPKPPRKGRNDMGRTIKRVADIPMDQGVRDVLTDQGIDVLYPPQQKALVPVMKGKNTVVAAPTSSGKSLIAYLATLRGVLEGGRAIYIVPLKALASEKYEDLQRFTHLGAKVGLFVGDVEERAQNIDKYNLVVATSEKVDSMLRHQTQWLEGLSVVIADEVHLINEPDRGPTLEIVISRLRQINKNLHVVALSATIKNSMEIAMWLNAEHILDDFRPVPLHEGIFHEDEIFFLDNKRTKITPTKDPMFDLMIDTIKGGGQCLIFVNSRRNAETLAKKLGLSLKQHLDQTQKEQLKGLSNKMIKGQSEHTSLGDSLGACAANGVAFHHAGLTSDQRKGIEAGFKQGILKCLCATPTLAAGINLPARRVVIRDVFRFDSQYGGIRPLPVMEVKQMAGRAGRPGLDPYGEAVLLAKNHNQRDQMISEYLLADPEPIYSKLAAQPALRMHILGAIATGYASTVQSLKDFFDTTFYGQQREVWMIEDEISNALEFLVSEGLIEEEDEALKATTFGKITSNLYIDPRSAVILRNSIQTFDKTGRTDEFSILLSVCLTNDMNTIFFREKEVETIRGFVAAHKEFLLNPIPTDHPLEQEMFLKSAKTAMMLHDWVMERTEDHITNTYNIGPGDIRVRVDVTKWLLGAMQQLSKLFSQKENPFLIQLRTRVMYGINQDLLDLVSLKGVGRVKGRLLYDKGFKSLEDIKSSSPTEMAKIRGIGKVLATRILEQLGVDISDSGIEDVKDTPENEGSGKKQSSLSEFM
jgi:helicase